MREAPLHRPLNQVYECPMGMNIPYMGTKRVLAQSVGEIVAHAQDGILLDAFSGMCAVGEAVGKKRQIWNNDAQIFASQVARAVFTSQDIPMSALECADTHFDNFMRQRKRLTQAFLSALNGERRLLQVCSFKEFSRRTKEIRAALDNDLQNCNLRSPRLFTTIYSATFFGVKQSIDADSIVYALCAAKHKRQITPDQYRWGIIALGRALLKIANSTGHFAQYLKPKANTLNRYLALRKRSVWEEWLLSMATISPVGNPAWRKENKAFNQDSLSLLPRLTREKADIGVVYADPPYTDDQYSRFYHLLETLFLYDYPEVTGAGLYRPDRFQTSFSLKSKAPKALDCLIKYTSKLGADLVLSYPANGLVREAGVDVSQLLKNHFSKVEICISQPHQHSTFGASKGQSKFQATEFIYFARC
jgi:adenine-specific DNA-methyltransferase